MQGWRAQQMSRGLRDETAVDRERLIRRFQEFTNEFPWHWTAAHVDGWSAYLTGESTWRRPRSALTRVTSGCSPSSSPTPATGGAGMRGGFRDVAGGDLPGVEHRHSSQWL